MPTFLHDYRILAWSLAAVAFLVAFLLILKIVEIAADLRRRLPRGSKSRQLRLGFVESYDLDGERQLMLVRRDNVEHLLMIGGPNDVLVESGILRVEPREARPPRSVEALASGAPTNVPAPHHAPSAAERPVAPLQPPVAEPRLAAPHPLAPPPRRRIPWRRPSRRSLRPRPRRQLLPPWPPPPNRRARRRPRPSLPRPFNRRRRRVSRFRRALGRPSRLSRPRRASRRRAPPPATSRQGRVSSRRPSPAA